ncbi:carbohydrate ABC transporter permease [Clostridium sp. KNHs205]|jgi:putative aldouronate transport system permease protein|uniref:carbohydrate ABC transporter permease n=1 Tax=Clostridium sp. KNHs205 TaxID=1449050 RepID=UPI00051B4089|nr:carbohydrate ABC transporter permease [Clostridium sp. KNHs205]
MQENSKIKLGSSDIIIKTVAYIFIGLFSLACLLPFILMISTSFSTEGLIRKTGFAIIPKGFTTYAYELVLRNSKQLFGSYVVTILMTVGGTLLGLFIISMTGYALQRKDFPFRNQISFYIYFTTLFSGGLVPFYLLISKYLGLKDNYLAVFLPLLMSPWLIILMKNFIKAIPFEITESGKIDGAGDITIFVKLILPMLKPALATIGLFLALGYWNEWYNSMLFLSAKVEYRPLQYHLYKIVNEVASLKNSVAGSNVVVTSLPLETLKMSTAVVATGPIILLYPFVQKYFIAGITVGAVKG